MLQDVLEGVTEEEVAIAPQIAHAKMPNKLDRPMMLVLVIPMARKVPQ